MSDEIPRSWLGPRLKKREGDRQQIRSRGQPGLRDTVKRRTEQVIARRANGGRQGDSVAEHRPRNDGNPESPHFPLDARELVMRTTAQLVASTTGVICRSSTEEEMARAAMKQAQQRAPVLGPAGEYRLA